MQSPFNDYRDTAIYGIASNSSALAMPVGAIPEAANSWSPVETSAATTPFSMRWTLAGG